MVTDKLKKIITIIVAISLVVLGVLTVLVMTNLQEEDQAPTSSFACIGGRMCGGQFFCPDDVNLARCEQQQNGGGGGGGNTNPGSGVTPPAPPPTCRNLYLCGGCAGNQNICLDGYSGCNDWRNRNCGGTDGTGNACAADGVHVSAAGGRCCPGLVQCGNGRCSPSCGNNTTPPFNPTNPNQRPPAGVGVGGVRYTACGGDNANACPASQIGQYTMWINSDGSEYATHFTGCVNNAQCASGTPVNDATRPRANGESCTPGGVACAPGAGSCVELRNVDGSATAYRCATPEQVANGTIGTPTSGGGGGGGTDLPDSVCRNQTILSCAVYRCPHGDTNGDGQCTFADREASRTIGSGADCTAPAQGGCYQVDFYNTSSGAETGGNSYCGHTGTVGTGACNPSTPPPPPPPSVTPYCGDGIFTPSIESCDPTAPAGNGNDPLRCDANCEFRQEVVNQCIDLIENGVDPIRSGAGNFMTYTFVYQHNSTTNPFPGIRLRVSTGSTAVGRDGNNASSSLVAPLPGSEGYTYDSVTGRHTYRFRWEAANVGGGTISDGTYDVRVLTDGTTAVTTPASCTETVQIQSSAEQQPLFTIIKESSPVCVENGDVRINYTLRVTNIGPVEGVIDFVRDTPDARLATAGISPTDISPSSGSYSNGVITWTGSVGDRTFAAGQSREYTYSILIPSAQTLNFIGDGVLNQALVQYDTTTTVDNTDSYDLRTVASCSRPSLPDTSIFDDGRFLLFGLFLTIIGAIVYRVDITRKISRPLVLKSQN